MKSFAALITLILSTIFMGSVSYADTVSGAGPYISGHEMTALSFYGNFSNSGNNVSFASGECVYLEINGQPQAFAGTPSYRSSTQVNIALSTIVSDSSESPMSCSVSLYYTNGTSSSAPFTLFNTAPIITGIGFDNNAGGDAYISLYGDNFKTSGNSAWVYCDLSQGWTSIPVSITYQSSNQINLAIPSASQSRYCELGLAFGTGAVATETGSGSYFTVGGTSTSTTTSSSQSIPNPTKTTSPSMANKCTCYSGTATYISSANVCQVTGGLWEPVCD